MEKEEKNLAILEISILKGSKLLNGGWGEEGRREDTRQNGRWKSFSFVMIFMHKLNFFRKRLEKEKT